MIPTVNRQTYLLPWWSHVSFHVALEGIGRYFFGIDLRLMSSAYQPNTKDAESP